MKFADAWKKFFLFNHRKALVLKFICSLCEGLFMREKYILCKTLSEAVIWISFSKTFCTFSSKLFFVSLVCFEKMAVILLDHAQTWITLTPAGTKKYPCLESQIMWTSMAIKSKKIGKIQWWKTNWKVIRELIWFVKVIYSVRSRLILLFLVIEEIQINFKLNELFPCQTKS